MPVGMCCKKEEGTTMEKRMNEVTDMTEKKGLEEMEESLEMLDLHQMGDLRHDVEILREKMLDNHRINPALYVEYDVKRGLRDSAGKGVLTGLTEISDVVAYKEERGRQIPIDGELYYQGVNVIELVKGQEGRKFGFEETIYLLLFGKLPDAKELDLFLHVMYEMQDLGARFVRDVIMKASNANIMNALQRCVLTLYTYDSNPDDVTPQNVLRQSLELINKLPLIAVYSYNSYMHFRKNKTLMIRNPKKGLSMAENILLMLRQDGRYTDLEAKVLDVALILHAEHGGGNNSTFTTHVVTSSGTDTYSSTAASIASLKGPKHGGANLKVQNMFKDIKEHVTDWNDEAALTEYLTKIMNKEAFDHSGLIYGMGHAVYTLSDPREVILKKYARELAEEKNLMDEFRLYESVEHIAGRLIMARKRVFKNICANVDFYSGFVYTMLGIPEELFTPIFAIARIPGWSAHRLEELLNTSKIIRPAYMYVGKHVPYQSMDER
jgi:citrate synthase